MSGEQGQLLKQLLNNGGGTGTGGGIRVIRRCAVATLVSPRHSHLVISQDKGKVGGVSVTFLFTVQLEILARYL